MYAKIGFKSAFFIIMGILFDYKSKFEIKKIFLLWGTSLLEGIKGGNLPKSFFCCCKSCPIHTFFNYKRCEGSQIMGIQYACERKGYPHLAFYDPYCRKSHNCFTMEKCFEEPKIMSFHASPFINIFPCSHCSCWASIIKIISSKNYLVLFFSLFAFKQFTTKIKRLWSKKFFQQITLWILNTKIMFTIFRKHKFISPYKYLKKQHIVVQLFVNM